MARVDCFFETDDVMSIHQAMEPDDDKELFWDVWTHVQKVRGVGLLTIDGVPFITLRNRIVRTLVFSVVTGRVRKVQCSWYGFHPYLWDAQRGELLRNPGFPKDVSEDLHEFWALVADVCQQMIPERQVGRYLLPEVLVVPELRYMPHDFTVEAYMVRISGVIRNAGIRYEGYMRPVLVRMVYSALAHKLRLRSLWVGLSPWVATVPTCVDRNWAVFNAEGWLK